MDTFGEMVQHVNSLLDQVLEGETLDKMADVYAVMAAKLEARGFCRSEVIEILSRQGGFKTSP